MDEITRNLFIGLILLIILVPIGLLAIGDTFGEWSAEEIKNRIGFVPLGLERLSSFWGAPIPDYTFSTDGFESGVVAVYYLSAIIGTIVCIGLLYFVGKRLAKG